MSSSCRSKFYLTDIKSAGNRLTACTNNQMGRGARGRGVDNGARGRGHRGDWGDWGGRGGRRENNLASGLNHYQSCDFKCEFQNFISSMSISPFQYEIVFILTKGSGKNRKNNKISKISGATYISDKID